MNNFWPVRVLRFVSVFFILSVCLGMYFYPGSPPPSSYTAGTGIAGKGNPGGVGGPAYGGGGGGSRDPGGNASPTKGGDGGAGNLSSITGTSTYYAGGGGGGQQGVGGVGGGGPGAVNPTTPTPSMTGQANTGSGGGGTNGNPDAGDGGPGVLIIAYPTEKPQISYFSSQVTYSLLPASSRPGYYVYKITATTPGAEFRV